MIPPASAAAGTVAPPVRFGIWYYQHGSLAEYWVPPEPGPIAKLPPLLSPVEFAREKTTIVSNLTNSGYLDGRLARGGHQQEQHLFTARTCATSPAAASRRPRSRSTITSRKRSATRPPSSRSA